MGKGVKASLTGLFAAIAALLDPARAIALLKRVPRSGLGLQTPKGKRHMAGTYADINERCQEGALEIAAACAEYTWNIDTGSGESVDCAGKMEERFRLIVTMNPFRGEPNPRTMFAGGMVSAYAHQWMEGTLPMMPMAMDVAETVAEMFGPL